MSFEDGPNGPRHRYRNDATFARVVDLFQAIIHDCHLAPSEMREAMMLAFYLYELHNPSPVTFRVEEFAKILIKDQQGGRRER